MPLWLILGHVNFTSILKISSKKICDEQNVKILNKNKIWLCSCLIHHNSPFPTPSSIISCVFIYSFGILLITDFFCLAFDFLKYCIKIIWISMPECFGSPLNVAPKVRVSLSLIQFWPSWPGDNIWQGRGRVGTASGDHGLNPGSAT